MIQIYDPNHVYTKDKENVLISHWFMRFWLTESVRQIHKHLQDEYNVLIFDNAWHWSNKKLGFTIENQKKVLEQVLNDDTIKNQKNHLIMSCLPWFLTIQNLAIEKKLLDNLQSITLSAPVIDIKSAINRNFESLWMSKKIWNMVLKSGLWNIFLRMKGVNANAIKINQLNNKYKPENNLNTIRALWKEIPLHVICNHKDPINHNLIDKIGEHSGLTVTTKHTDRHHVYFQEWYDYSTLQASQEAAIGDLVRIFINNNNGQIV